MKHHTALLSDKHSTIKDYVERMTYSSWKDILLAEEDIVSFNDVSVQLFAKDLGYGVVEVSKYKITKNKGKIYG